MAKVRFAELSDALLGAVVIVVKDGKLEIYEGVDDESEPSDFLIVQDGEVIGHSRMSEAEDVSDEARSALNRHFEIEEPPA